MSEINREKLSRFLTSVDQEIELIKVGESKFRGGSGMHFGPEEKSGVLTRLKIFKDNPTPESLALFLALASQDLGTRVGEAFTLWSQGIFTPTEKEIQEAKKPKPYAEVIKDGFYDMFRAAHISMSQKQVEQIEASSLRLAKAFEERITAGIKEQLDHLVDVLNAQKAEEQEREAKVPKPKVEVTEVKVPKPRIYTQVDGTEDSDTNV